MPPSLPSVLIVDDDQDFCASLFDCLELEGSDVNATHDPQTALHLVRAEPYDVALVDLQMPGMDGLALFQALRREAPQIRGILLTSFAGVETEANARQSGFDQVIEKPVQLLRLIGLLQDVGSREGPDKALNHS